MYNFKKEIKVYISSDNSLYPLDVYPDITFSQTYVESDYGKKTLHNQLALYRGGNISEANPANFSFTVPIKNSADLTVISDSFAADYITGNIESFDLYIQLSNDFYKITKAVIQNTVFNIERTAILTASISGTAANIDQIAALPSTPKARPSDPYVIIRGMEVAVNGTVLDSIASVHIEVDNSITWIPNNTVNAAVAGQVTYRTSYVTSERRISGSITQFLTSANKTVGWDYSTTHQISIKIYSDVTLTPFIIFNLPETIYTRRLNIDDLVTRVYDFRLTSGNIAVIPNVK